MTGTDEQLLGEIAETLGGVLERPVEITPDTNIVSDLGLDSIAVMNFSLAIEDRYDISIPLDQMADVATVSDLMTMIQTLRKAN